MLRNSHTPANQVASITALGFGALFLYRRNQYTYDENCCAKQEQESASCARITEMREENVTKRDTGGDEVGRQQEIERNADTEEHKVDNKNPAKEEILALKKKLEIANADRNKLSEQLQILASRLDEADKIYKKEIESVKKASKESMHREFETFEATIQSMEIGNSELSRNLKLLQGENEDVRRECDLRIQKVREDHKREIEELQEKNGIEVKAARAQERLELEALREEATEKAKLLDVSNKKCDDFRLQVDVLKNELIESKSRGAQQLQQQIKELNAKFQTEMEDTKKKAQEEILSLRTSLETANTDKTKLSEQLQQVLASRLEEAAEIKKKEIEVVKKTAQESMQKELEAFEATIKDMEIGNSELSRNLKLLQGENEDVRRECDLRIKKVREDHKREIEELQEKNGIEVKAACAQERLELEEEIKSLRGLLEEDKDWKKQLSVVEKRSDELQRQVNVLKNELIESNSRGAQQLQQHIEESKAKLEKEIEDVKNEAREEIFALQTSLEIANTDKTKLSEQLRDLSNTLDEAYKVYKQEIKVVKKTAQESMQKELEALNATIKDMEIGNSELSRNLKLLQGENEDVRRECDLRIQKVKEDHEREIEELQEKNGIEVKAACAQERLELEEEIKSLRGLLEEDKDWKKQLSVVEKRSDELQRQVNVLKNELIESKSRGAQQLQHQIEESKAKFGKEIEDIKNEAREEIFALQTSLETAHTDKMKLSEQLRDLSNTLDKAYKVYKQEIRVVKKTAQESMQKELEALNATIKDMEIGNSELSRNLKLLQGENEDVRRECDLRIKKVREDHKREIEELQEKNGIEVKAARAQERLELEALREEATEKAKLLDVSNKKCDDFRLQVDVLKNELIESKSRGEQQLQQQTEESKAKLEKEIEDVKNKAREEILSLRTSLETANTDKMKLSEQLRDLSNTLEEAYEVHEQEIEVVKKTAQESMQKELEALNATIKDMEIGNSELSRNLKLLKGENEDVRRECDLRIQKVREDHKREIEELQEKNRIEVKAARAQERLELEALREEATEKAKLLDVSNKKCDDFRLQVDVLKNKLIESQQLQQQIEESKAKFGKEIEDIKNEAREEIFALQTSLETANTDKTKLSEQLRDLSNTLEEAYEVHEQEIEVVKKTAQESMQKELEALNATIKDMEIENSELSRNLKLLQGENEDVRRECDLRIQKVREDHKREIEELQEKNGIEVKAARDQVDFELEALREEAIEKAKLLDVSNKKCDDFRLQVDVLKNELIESNSRRAQQLQQQIEESNAKFQTEMEDAKNKAQEEIFALQTSLETANTDKNKLSAQLRVLTTRLDKVGKVCRQEIEVVKKTSQDAMERELEALETVQSIEMCDSELTMDVEVEHLQGGKEAVRREYDLRVQKVREDHGREIEELLAQLDLVEEEHKERYNEKEKLVHEKDAVISGLGSQLAEAQTRLSALSDKQESMEKELAILTEQLMQSRIETAAKNEDINRLLAEHRQAMEDQSLIREQACEEAREEMIKLAEVQFEQRNAHYKKLKHEFDNAVSKIGALESELKAVKSEAAAAKKQWEAREIDLADELAQAKAATASSDLNAARNIKQYRTELEDSKALEAELRRKLEEAQATSQSIQSTFAGIVSEKERLMKENNDLQAVCEELMAEIEASAAR